MEASKSLDRDTVGFCRARCSAAPVLYARKSLICAAPAPAAAFIGAEEIWAVVTFGVKNPTGGVSHKQVANATTLLNPSLLDLIDLGETPKKQLPLNTWRTQSALETFAS